ncbi:MAG: glycosyl transferase, partial [Proteobacteria bacterium]|nr:glycosyl transferase [Pseudomonadota bacterium]
PLLPRTALANSRNVPAVQLLTNLGLDYTYGLYRDLDLHHDDISVDHFGLGLALGGMPVTLIDLVGAYTTIAGDGQYRHLRWHDEASSQPGRQIFRQETAEAIASYLSDPMARLPGFPRMGNSELPFAVAVKTGTSPDYRDAWAVAWSEDYLVGVWVGHPDWTPMQKLSGYVAGAQLTQDLLLDLHGPRQDFVFDAFLPPQGWAPVEVCPFTGAVATDRCDGTTTEWFPKDGIPIRECAAHIRVGDQVMLDLPSRYGAWARKAGLPLAPSPAVVASNVIEVQVLSPRDGTRVMRDPEAPLGMDTLLLQAAVDPPVSQLVWYVDGEPLDVVEAPYETRWPIEPGRHIIEARVALMEFGSQKVVIDGG